MPEGLALSVAAWCSPRFTHRRNHPRAFRAGAGAGLDAMGAAGPLNSAVELEGCALSGLAFRVFCPLFSTASSLSPGLALLSLPGWLLGFWRRKGDSLRCARARGRLCTLVYWAAPRCVYC
eukprot:8252415-Pyramimonas_sp.AAC.1